MMETSKNIGPISLAMHHRQGVWWGHAQFNRVFTDPTETACTHQGANKIRRKAVRDLMSNARLWMIRHFLFNKEYEKCIKMADRQMRLSRHVVETTTCRTELRKHGKKYERAETLRNLAVEELQKEKK